MRVGVCVFSETLGFPDGFAFSFLQDLRLQTLAFLVDEVLVLGREVPVVGDVIGRERGPH